MRDDQDGAPICSFFRFSTTCFSSLLQTEETNNNTTTPQHHNPQPQHPTPHTHEFPFISLQFSQVERSCKYAKTNMKQDTTSEIVTKVMNLSASHSKIKFIGQATTSDNNLDIICSSTVLFDVFQELIRKEIQSEIWYVTFGGFDFEELPQNIGQVLIELKYCIFIDCPNVSSLGTTVCQFPLLQVLVCRCCPSLTSFSSLEVLPRNSLLCNVAFKDCGLQVTSDDGWDKGLQALGRTTASMCILTIQNCPYLKVLPSSIINLSKKSCTQIVLVSNSALKRLPLELGDLRNLKTLRIHHCPQIQELPWTMSRIPECSISVNDNPVLIENLAEFVIINDGQKMANCASRSSFRIKVSEIEAYFKDRRRRFIMGIIKLKIYLHRGRKRAIERLYRPGGAVFHRSKINFETMAMKTST